MSKKQRKSDCPIHFALDVFGDKWTLLIIRDLMFKGKHYFGEFLQMEEGISTNILADRLYGLEKAAIVSKTVDKQHKSKQEYKLTPKGIDLLPLVTEVILWSAKYDTQTAAEKTFISKARKDRVALYSEIIRGLN